MYPLEYIIGSIGQFVVNQIKLSQLFLKIRLNKVVTFKSQHIHLLQRVTERLLGKLLQVVLTYQSYIQQPFEVITALNKIVLEVAAITASLQSYDCNLGP